MGIYERIKKQHVFVFLIFLCALILFDYFDSGYSGLVVRQKENCLSSGGVCCVDGTGRGERLFSLDSTCGDRECWTECGASEKVNYGAGWVSGASIFETINNELNSGWSWVKGLFGKKVVGGEVSVVLGKFAVYQGLVNVKTSSLDPDVWIIDKRDGICSNKGAEVADTSAKQLTYCKELWPETTKVEQISPVSTVKKPFQGVGCVDTVYNYYGKQEFKCIKSTTISQPSGATQGATSAGEVVCGDVWEEVAYDKTLHVILSGEKETEGEINSLELPFPITSGKNCKLRIFANGFRTKGTHDPVGEVFFRVEIYDKDNKKIYTGKEYKSAYMNSEKIHRSAEFIISSSEISDVADWKNKAPFKVKLFAKNPGDKTFEMFNTALIVSQSNITMTKEPKDKLSFCTFSNKDVSRDDYRTLKRIDYILGGYPDCPKGYAGKQYCNPDGIWNDSTCYKGGLTCGKMDVFPAYKDTNAVSFGVTTFGGVMGSYEWVKADASKGYLVVSLESNGAGALPGIMKSITLKPGTHFNAGGDGCKIGVYVNGWASVPKEDDKPLAFRVKIIDPETRVQLHDTGFKELMPTKLCTTEPCIPAWEIPTSDWPKKDLRMEIWGFHGTSAERKLNGVKIYSTLAPPSCGNGGIDSGEVCDGTNLNGKSCSTTAIPETEFKTYNAGILTCNADCKGFDTSGCKYVESNEGGTIQTCGNGALEADKGEECEIMTNNNVKYIRLVVPSDSLNHRIFEMDNQKDNACKLFSDNEGIPFISGNLGCENCKLVKTGCVSSPTNAGGTGTGGTGTGTTGGYCGDGVIQTGELCEMASGGYIILPSPTGKRSNFCAEYDSNKYQSEQFYCNPDCKSIDFSSCVLKSTETETCPGGCALKESTYPHPERYSARYEDAKYGCGEGYYCAECYSKMGYEFAGNDCYKACKIKTSTANYTVDPALGYKSADCYGGGSRPLPAGATSTTYVRVPAGDEYCSAKYHASGPVCYGIKETTGGAGGTGTGGTGTGGNGTTTTEKPTAPGMIISTTYTETDDNSGSITFKWKFDPKIFPTGTTLGGGVVGIDAITGRAIGDNEEKGFFSSVWDGISGFFSRLFGGRVVGVIEGVSNTKPANGFCFYRTEGLNSAFDKTTSFVGCVELNSPSVKCTDVSPSKMPQTQIECQVTDKNIPRKDTDKRYSYKVTIIRNRVESDWSYYSASGTVPKQETNNAPIIYGVYVFSSQNQGFSENNKVGSGGSFTATGYLRADIRVLTTDDRGFAQKSGALLEYNGNSYSGTFAGTTAVTNYEIYSFPINIKEDSSNMPVKITMKDSGGKSSSFEFKITSVFASPVPSIVGIYNQDGTEISSGVVINNANHIPVIVKVSNSPVVNGEYLNVVTVTNTILEQDNPRRTTTLVYDKTQSDITFWKTPLSQAFSSGTGTFVPIYLKCGETPVANVIEASIDTENLGGGAGGKSSKTVTVNCGYFEDSEAPAVTIQPVSSYSNTNKFSLNIQIVEEDGMAYSGDTYTATLYATKAGGENVPLVNNIKSFVVGSSSPASWHNLFRWDNVELPDVSAGQEASYQIWASVKDISPAAQRTVGGGALVTSNKVTLTIDKKAPTTSLYIDGETSPKNTGEYTVQSSLKGELRADENGAVVTCSGDAQCGGDDGVAVVYFNEAGTFTITAYSVDQAGNKGASKTWRFTIRNAGPKINFVNPASTIIQEDVGTQINFLAEVSDPDSSSLTYWWKHDGVQQGNVETLSYDGKTPALLEHSIAYASADAGQSKKVSLHVSDGKNEAVKEIIIAIKRQKQVEANIYSPLDTDRIYVNREVIFEGYADDTDDATGKIVSYEWYTRTSINPTYVLENADASQCSSISSYANKNYCRVVFKKTFSETGTYYVKFKVTDDDGVTSFTEKKYTVLDLYDPEIKIISPEPNKDYYDINTIISSGSNIPIDQSYIKMDASICLKSKTTDECTTVSGSTYNWKWTFVERETNIEYVFGGVGKKTMQITGGKDIPQGYYNVVVSAEGKDAVGADFTSSNRLESVVHVKSSDAPNVVIVTPNTLKRFYLGEWITFEGSATDPNADEGDYISKWVWKRGSDSQGSNEETINDALKWTTKFPSENVYIVDPDGDGWDGVLRTDKSDTFHYRFRLKADALGLGTHYIRVIVTDSLGAVKHSDDYIIQIFVDPTTAPRVQINKPTFGTNTEDVCGNPYVVAYGENVYFEAKVWDPAPKGTPTGSLGKVCEYKWILDGILLDYRRQLDTNCQASGYGGDVPIGLNVDTKEMGNGLHTVSLTAWEDDLHESTQDIICINVVPSSLRRDLPNVGRVQMDVGGTQLFKFSGGLGADSYKWEVDGGCGKFVLADGTEKSSVDKVAQATFKATKENSNCDVVVSSGVQSISTAIEVKPKVSITNDITLSAVISNHDTYGYVMKLSWNRDTSLSGANKYELQYRKGSSGTWTALPGEWGKIDIAANNYAYHYGSSSCGAGKTQCLENGATYEYRMKILDSASNVLADWGNTATAVMSYSSFVEDCNNPLSDSDGDGVVAGIDSGCPNLHLVKMDESKGIETNVGIDNATYVGTNINVNCYFNIVNSAGSVVEENAYYSSGYKCINLKVGGVEYTNGQQLSTKGAVRFRGINVGDAVGDKVVRCEVNSKCNWYGLFYSLERTIKVEDFEYCPEDIGGGLSISKVSLDESSYEAGDEMEVEVEVKNEDLSNRDIDVIVSAQIFDVDTEENLAEEEQQQEIESDKDETFNINMTIPDDIDADHQYVVLVKAYEEGEEEDICVQANKFIKLKEKEECDTDEDDDNYASEECGGDDCDDDDENINPSEAEICTDGEDNDCDDDVDDEDSDCVSCVNGRTKSCGKDTGECSAGTQTCTSGAWGECLGMVGPNYENCADGKDNDCDGSPDCDDPDCYDVCTGQGVIGDSDGDGLPDDWEMEYFGNLAMGADEDADGDGVSNYEEWLNGTDPNTADAAGGKWWVWVLLVIAITGLGAVIAVMLVNKKKAKMGKLGQGVAAKGTGKGATSGYITANKQAELKEYVKKALARGFKKEQIERVLLAKGWMRKDINNAFK